VDTQILLGGLPGFSTRGYLGWCNIILLREGGKNILVDTGHHSDRQLLREKLQEFDLVPESIDQLVITHLHFDHCLNMDMFAKAEVIVGQAEYDYAFSDEPARLGDPFVPEVYLRAMRHRFKTFVKDGDLLADGRITVLDLPGDTPGGIGLKLNEEKTIITGDAVKNAWSFLHNNPGHCFGGSKTALQTFEKLRTFQNFTVISGHDLPFTLAGDKVCYQGTRSVVMTINTDPYSLEGKTLVIG